MAAELNKDGKRIRAMFSGIAPWYDFLNHFLSLNIDRYWRNRMTKLVPPEGNDPILDVCTGTGDLALAYHAASKGKIKIVGSDFCLPMLESAYKKNKKRGLGISFLEADTLNLPFSENHFQLTTVAFGIRNVADTEAGILEMIRVTKPGGRVAILEFSRPKGWFLGNLYLFYFQRMLPLLGQLFPKVRMMPTIICAIVCCNSLMVSNLPKNARPGITPSHLETLHFWHRNPLLGNQNSSNLIN